MVPGGRKPSGSILDLHAGHRAHPLPSRPDLDLRSTADAPITVMPRARIGLPAISTAVAVISRRVTRPTKLLADALAGRSPVASFGGSIHAWRIAQTRKRTQPKVPIPASLTV